MTNIIMFIDFDYSDLVINKLKYIIYDVDGKLIKKYNETDNNLIDYISDDLDLVDTVIGYNISTIIVDFYRLKNKIIIDKLNNKKKLCFKIIAKNYLKLLTTPSLPEIYNRIFKNNKEKNIDNLTMCSECYFEIIYNNCMNKK